MYPYVGKYSMNSQRVLSDVNMALLKVIGESHHSLYGRLSQGGRETCAQRLAVAVHHGPIWFGQAHQAQSL